MSEALDIPTADRNGGVVLPPGTYVIGDPCIHLSPEQWEQVLYESDDFEQTVAPFELTGGGTGYVVAFQTQQGDGLYTDLDGNDYPVDSGTIGIIPREFVNELFEDSANVMTFETPVVCFSTRDGNLVFGHIEIATSGDVGSDDFDEGYDDEY